jgi:HPt (histidine-containing phosphotransfer) domain-containing protein
MDTIFVKVPGSLLPFMDDYILHVRNFCRDIRKLLENGEFEKASFDAHRLKGEGAAYGFEMVTEYCSMIQEMAEADEGILALEALERLEEYMSRVKVI